MRVVFVMLVVAAALLIIRDAKAHRLPHQFVRGALCIHSHEGSWRDGGAPYYGGMQMDWAFMRMYGPRLLRRLGTADRWSPHQQLDVAYRAWRVRGWSPWPVSSRLCGLGG
jgi:hypothetical protein